MSDIELQKDFDELLGWYRDDQKSIVELKAENQRLRGLLEMCFRQSMMPPELLKAIADELGFEIDWQGVE